MAFPTEENIRKFEEYIDLIKETYGAVGLAVSIFDTENVLFQKVLGVRDREKGGEINDDTIFGLASVSKSFTIMSIMQLYRKGIIDINAPVSDYIPEYHGRPDYPVLVSHLMCHAAGYFPQKRIWVEHVAKPMGIWNDGKDELTYNAELAAEGCRLVADRLNAQTGFTGRPGERMSYSNDGFALLSEIIRRYGGEPSYADYVRKNILEPLGMSRSSAEYIAPLHDPNTVHLYKKKNGVLSGDFDFYSNAFVLPGGGAMKSTLRDMRSYVRMYMQHGRPIMDDYYIREMIRPRQEYRFGMTYGYGISSLQLENGHIYQHSGSLPGVSSHFGWSPEIGVGLVILCNTSDVPVAQISTAAFRLFGGLEPVHGPHFEEKPWSEETARSVAGTYPSGEGTVIELSYDGRLHLTIAGKEREFFPAAPDMLIVKNPVGVSDMLFLSDDERGVWGIRWGGRIIAKI